MKIYESMTRINYDGELLEAEIECWEMADFRLHDPHLELGGVQADNLTFYRSFALLDGDLS